MLHDPLDKAFYFWRLDEARHAPTWALGIGAEKVGGRWNPKGTPAVYGSLDASTAILEVAVHKGFDALDCKPYILTQVRIPDQSHIHVLDTGDIANPNWLAPGTPSRGQQAHGAGLLAQYPFVLVPSSVSRYSWNLVMNPALANGLYEVIAQTDFALDGRLSPPLP